MQLVEQRLSLFQIERVEPFCEPAIDRSEEIASLIPLTLVAPEPRHAHRRTEFPGLCLLRAGDDQSALEVASGEHQSGRLTDVACILERMIDVRERGLRIAKDASATGAYTYRAYSAPRGQGGAYRRSPSEDASGADGAACLRNLRNLHGAILRQIGRCHLFQTDPPEEARRIAPTLLSNADVIGIHRFSSHPSEAASCSSKHHGGGKQRGHRARLKSLIYGYQSFSGSGGALFGASDAGASSAFGATGAGAISVAGALFAVSASGALFGASGACAAGALLSASGRDRGRGSGGIDRWR